MQVQFALDGDHYSIEGNYVLKQDDLADNVEYVVNNGVLAVTGPPGDSTHSAVGSYSYTLTLKKGDEVKYTHSGVLSASVSGDNQEEGHDFVAGFTITPGEGDGFNINIILND